MAASTTNTTAAAVIGRASARTAALVAVIVLALGWMLATAAPAKAELVLDHGHTDIFNVSPRGTSLALEVKEDVTGRSVIHDPENVSLVVKQSAYRRLSGDFARFNGPSGGAYVLPLTQDPSLLWPGWDTQEVTRAGLSAVDIDFDRVSGPGKVYLFTQHQGLSGGIAPLLEGGSYELTSGAVRHQDPPAHTHAYWVFTAPGTYTMEVTARAGDKASDTETYTWIVGDGTTPPPASTKPRSDEKSTNDDTTPGTNTGGDTATTKAGTTTASGEDAAAALATATAKLSQAIKEFFASLATWPALSSGSPRPSATASTTAPTPSPLATEKATAPTPAEAAGPKPAARRLSRDDAGATGAQDTRHTCRPVNESTSTHDVLVPAIRDDRFSPAKLVNPEAYRFHVGDKAIAHPQQRIGDLAAGQTVWMIGSVQVPGVPWIGANTMDRKFLADTTGELSITPIAMTGPGDLEVFTSGNFGVAVGKRWFSFHSARPAGGVTISRNTHVHPNWVFTKPGVYTVSLRFTARTKSGDDLVTTTRLHFTVGGPAAAGDVTQGHFDLGAAIGRRTATTTRYVDAQGRPCAAPRTTGTGGGHDHGVEPAPAPVPAAEPSGTTDGPDGADGVRDEAAATDSPVANTLPKAPGADALPQAATQQPAPTTAASGAATAQDAAQNRDGAAPVKSGHSTATLVGVGLSGLVLGIAIGFAAGLTTRQRHRRRDAEVTAS